MIKCDIKTTVKDINDIAMKRIFTISTLAAVILSSCAKEQTSASCSSPDVKLNVSIPVSEMTRITDTGDEAAVNHAQVFVFREDGITDAWTISDSGDMVIDCTAGLREIVAIVNAPRITNIFNIEDLKKEITVLQDNAPGSLVMSGRKTVELEASTSVVVPVKRLVARVSIESIVTDFSLEQYRDAHFRITGIYLTNIAGDAHFITSDEPSIWYNAMYKDNIEGNLTKAGELTKTGNLSEPLSEGTAYETAHHFYCYPNPFTEDSFSSEWCPRHTRLVVEAELSGRICYYTMTMPVIESNHIYTVKELRITRPGSSDPELPVLPGDASFTIEVEDWEDGYSSSFEI